MEPSIQEPTEAGSISRPKIHRLPLPPLRDSEPDSRLISRFVWSFGALAVVMMVGVVYQFTGELLEKPAPQGQDALQAALTDYPAVPSTPEKDGNSLHLKEGGNVIVGQLAKIPPERERVTDIKTLADIDKPAGRDLLSIISKY